MIPSGYEPAFFMACLLLVVGLLMLIPGSFGRRGDLLSVKNAVLVIYLAIYGWSAIDRILFRQPRLPDEDMRLVELLLYANLGLIAFGIGYFWTRARRLSLLIPKPPDGVSRTKYRLLIRVFILVSLISAVVLEVAGGGIIGRLLSPLDLRNTAEIDWWYFYIQWGLLLIQVATWSMLAFRLSVGKTKRLSLLMIGTLVLAILLSFSQNRTLVINLLLPILLLFHYHVKRLRAQHLAVIAALGLSYFLGWDVYRNATVGREFIRETMPRAVYDGVMANLDYLDSLLSASARIPDHDDFRGGQTYLSLLFKPIPRSLWQDKPLGGNSALTLIVDPDAFQRGFSRAASVITEAFVNFSWVGVPILLFVVGVICRALMQYRLRYAGNPWATVLYAIGVVGMMTFIRVDAQVSSTFVIYYAAPLILLWIVCGRYYPADIRRLSSQEASVKVPRSKEPQTSSLH